LEATACTPLDRVAERRRAVALARYYREAEGLSIAQIAQRLGRAPATVRGYFYDPSNANKKTYGHPARPTPASALGGAAHGRSLPALELTTARYTRAYQSQHQERKFFPRRIFFALGLAVQHVR
jgi:transcriptional regulator with XRE-family HTH domain